MVKKMWAVFVALDVWFPLMLAVVCGLGVGLGWPAAEQWVKEDEQRQIEEWRDREGMNPKKTEKENRPGDFREP